MNVRLALHSLTVGRCFFKVRRMHEAQSLPYVSRKSPLLLARNIQPQYTPIISSKKPFAGLRASDGAASGAYEDRLGLRSRLTHDSTAAHSQSKSNAGES